MKVFFWDFDEEYSQVISSYRISDRRRDFIDYFLGAELGGLIEAFPEFSHGIITNGNLGYQFALLKANDLNNLFEVDFSNSPSIEAKILVENFPLLAISHHFKKPISFNQDKDYFNLVSSLSKPNGYIYQEILREKGISSKDCYVVGTDAQDFLAAKNAGINSIHILGWEEKEKFNLENLKSKPNYIINQEDMYSGLEKIFYKILEE